MLPVDFKYRINIEGKNTVTGITPDNKNNKNKEKAEKDISCSKLFEFKNATNNSGRTIVSIDGKVVFDADKGINLPPNKRDVGFLFQVYRRVQGRRL